MFTSDTKRFLSGAASSIKVKKVFGFMVVASFLSGLMPSAAIAADTGASAPAATMVPMNRPQVEIAPMGKQPQAQLSKEEWHKAMIQLPHPKKTGCFKATHPKLEWQEVTCTTPPPYPQPPRRGVRPDVVGNGTDISAQVASGFIATAIGSFENATGVTSVSGPIANSGPSIANAYTLQINTNFFASTACAGSPNPSCLGWEQFVFLNDGTSGMAFIQYWLIKYNAACPAGGGWNQFSFTGSTDIYCYRNSPTAVPVPNYPITSNASLQNLTLTGAVSATGDSVSVSTNGTIYSTPGANSVNAAAGWTIAEFNIFGDGGNSAGGGQVSFNPGASFNVRTRIINGAPDAPTCSVQGFTGETNNLNFGPTAPAVTQPGPAILFAESIAGGLIGCAAAVAVGDTHLTTFGGLLKYDFQASGDFVLTQSERNFVVQTRQVSAKPTWPDASLNSAVATRMGKTTLALCIAPAGNTAARLVIDGKITNLADGKSLELPSGVDVLRRGNMYLITDPEGDSVRAVVNSINANANNWIDVDVGLGHWPAKVSGLLANPSGNANALEARDGTVFPMPISFADLYGHFGDSWRVQPNESLLSACGGKKIEIGIPSKPFYASDLKPQVYQRARATCAQAGIKEGTHLDDCILDVAVIGHKTAARVFVGRPIPLRVMPKIDLRLERSVIDGRLPVVNERLPGVNR